MSSMQMACGWPQETAQTPSVTPLKTRQLQEVGYQLRRQRYSELRGVLSPTEMELGLRVVNQGPYSRILHLASLIAVVGSR